MVTPAYYRTFGIATVRGRPLTEDDRAGSTRVATVNQAFVRRYLPDVDPIGQRVMFAPFVSGTPVASRAGAVGDRRRLRRRRQRRPRTRGAAGDAGVVLADAMAAGDPRGEDDRRRRRTSPPASPRWSAASIRRCPLTGIRTIEQTLSESVASDRFYTVFFAGFAVVALALAAIGIYGVMSFAVAQRTHEIGLRMALGARRSQVLGQILREGMSTALLGTAIGGVGAILIGRALKGAVSGVDSTNPLLFVAVAALLLTAALIACVVPARRAATVDPMVALRQD